MDREDSTRQRCERLRVRRALLRVAFVAALSGCASAPYWSRQDQAASEKRDLTERLARAEAALEARDAEIERLAARLRELEARGHPAASAPIVSSRVSPQAAPQAREAIASTTAPLEPASRAPSRIDESDLEELSPSAGARSAPAPEVDPAAGAQGPYDAALDLLELQNYAAAENAFRELLTRHPDSDLADNAQYWLAESFLRRGDTARAIDEFRAVVERYPEGNKVPDALLKMARGLEQLEDAVGAFEIYRELAARFPGSAAAEAARSRLAALPPEPRP